MKYVIAVLIYIVLTIGFAYIGSKILKWNEPERIRLQVAWLNFKLALGVELKKLFKIE